MHQGYASSLSQYIVEMMHILYHMHKIPSQTEAECHLANGASIFICRVIELVISIQ